MSHIKISRKHEIGYEAARAAAEETATHLDEEFTLHHEWDGSRITFHRMGLKGTMDVGEEDVSLDVRLSVFLAPMRKHFEEEIHKYLDQLFEKGAQA
jgi:putative polyhydroxyalkanoate system protein